LAPACHEVGLPKAGSSDALRVGVAGLGWAGQQHLASYLDIPGVDVVGLAGQEHDTLAQLGKEHGIPVLCADAFELAAHPGIDALSVAVPNALHAPLALAALRAGKHVLCEKPMACTSAEAASMAQAASDAERLLHVVFNWRERDDVRQVHDLVAKGSIGRVHLLEAGWVRSQVPAPGAWFAHRDPSGGGVLLDLGIHILDMALFVLGEPAVTALRCDTYAEAGRAARGEEGREPIPPVGESEVDDFAVVTMHTSSGTTVILRTGWAGYGMPENEVTLSVRGMHGSARVRSEDYGWEGTLDVFTADGDQVAQTTPALAPPGGHAAVVRRFVDTVLAGAYDDQAGWEAARRSQLLDACLESARLGREVVVG
jgi:predicted dehydrogenase